MGTRNVGTWYSEDKGKAWSAPLDLDATTQDAGYGDMRPSLAPLQVPLGKRDLLGCGLQPALPVVYFQ
ncbi:MAG: hypothetical protein ACC645_11450 [Pirellulales bacterium]